MILRNFTYLIALWPKILIFLFFVFLYDFRSPFHFRFPTTLSTSSSCILFYFFHLVHISLLTTYFPDFPYLHYISPIYIYFPYLHYVSPIYIYFPYLHYISPIYIYFPYLHIFPLFLVDNLSILPIVCISDYNFTFALPEIILKAFKSDGKFVLKIILIFT